MDVSNLVEVVGEKARKESANSNGMEWIFSAVKSGHNAIQQDPYIKQFGFTNEHINLLLAPMALHPDHLFRNSYASVHLDR